MMAKSLLLIVAFLLVTLTVQANLDKEVEKKEIKDTWPVLSAILEKLFLPKECIYYTKLSSLNRSMDYKSAGNPLCDAKLLSGWYRFTKTAGSQMATQCVPQEDLYCSALNPGWLRGGHPSIVDGRVQREVCFHAENKCCYASVNIQVRNCGPFYVYYLTGVPCPFRYCGGHTEIATASPTSELEPTTTPEPTFPTEPENMTTSEPITTALPPFSTEPKNMTTTEPNTTTLPPLPTEPENVTTSEPVTTVLPPFPTEPENMTTTEPNTTALPSFPGQNDECSHYKTLVEPNRAMSFYDPFVVSGDYNLQTNWYRFIEGAGTKMADECVSVFHCGTHAPGWLQGGHPTNATRHAVARDVCFNWRGDCCHFKGRIHVRQCGDFFIYKLRKIRFKYLRYCGNGRPVVLS